MVGKHLIKVNMKTQNMTLRQQTFNPLTSRIENCSREEKKFEAAIYRRRLLAKHFRDELRAEQRRILSGHKALNAIPSTRRAEVKEVELDESM
jgi:hypothetical protein